MSQQLLPAASDQPRLQALYSNCQRLSLRTFLLKFLGSFAKLIRMSPVFVAKLRQYGDESANVETLLKPRPSAIIPKKCLV